MNVLHITPSTDGYEEVKLLANAVDRRNNLSVIEKNGQIYYTGGFLLNDTPQIRQILDGISKKDQYNFVKSFKTTPFVDFYYDKEKVKEQEQLDVFGDMRRIGLTSDQSSEVSNYVENLIDKFFAIFKTKN